MLVIYIVLFLGILPSVFVLLKQNKIKSIRSYYPMIFLVGFGSIYEFIFTILLKINSEYWFRFYDLISFLLISYYFKSILKKKNYKLIYLVNIIYIIFYAFLFLFWDRSVNLDTGFYLNALQTIFIFVFSILWFVNIFKSLTYDSLLKNPHFYFVSGLILYYTGTVFFFLMSSVIFEKEKIYILDYWMLNIFFNFIYRILLLIGIWKAIQK
jgi:hypothetical protein